MKRFICSFTILIPVLTILCLTSLHAEEKRLGQMFIDAFYAKDEAAMKALIKENKESVSSEVEMMLSYAVENKVGWMVDVCGKMAALYKEETGDDSLSKKINKVMESASAESQQENPLDKLNIEVTAIGKGHWKITSAEYNEKKLKLEIGVDPEIGADIDKADVEAVGKVVEKLLPEAFGQITWSSFGVGVASLLKEKDSTSWKTSKK